MATSLNDWITKKIKPTLPCGRLLEIGPSELWPGLKIIKNSPDLDLISIGHNADQQLAAVDQAKEMGVNHQITFISTISALSELEDHSVDAVISFGALHSWIKPANVLDEINRVLKHQGLYFIGDARSDRPFLSRWLNFNQDPNLKNLYQHRHSKWSLSSIRDMLLVTKLEQAKIKVQGPDIWITNAV